MRRACLLALTTLLLVAGTAAGQSVRSGVKPDYRGRGVVLAMLPPPSDLHATRPVIVIEHEPIAGLMDEKMSMPFIAASTALFQGLHKGDRIAFGLKDTPDALLVVLIERLSGP
jgi:Copper binding periplasmic protein CusF